MKISRIETTKLEMPYKKPLVTATNNFTVARGLLVKAVTDEGVEGYGYSDLFPRTGETPESAAHFIDTVLKPKVVECDLDDLGRIRADIDHVLAGNPRAKAALEGALYDALARSVHIPLYLLFGGRYRNDVKVIKMVSVGAADAMADEARQLVTEGMALKLKIDGKIEADLTRVAAVRKAVGDGVFIKVDANEAYDANGDPFGEGLADHGVEIFEQPVPRDQFEALWEVKKHSPVKIEADQSVRSVADAQMLIKNRMIDAINTGIPKVGSIGDVRKIAELCHMNGIGCTLSNTAGSMVGDAAAIHLAVSTPGIAPLCELGEFEVITGDPFFGLTVENGAISVPEGEGLGVSLRGF